MKIIDNLTSNNHYSEVEKLSSTSDELILVSPFCFGDFNVFFENIIANSNIKKISLITTLKSNEIINKTSSIQSFINNASNYSVDKEVSINNKLHGKIYIFKSNGENTDAIITSANITHNGLHRNHEWGCLFSDVNVIDSLEQNINSAIEYNLTDDIIKSILTKISEHKPQQSNIPTNTIDISDIIIPYRYNINLSNNTQIFLKPIGHSGNKIYDGDYSGETEQYFSKRYPKAVHKNDYLISYAVGARKIISIFKVLSDKPINTGNEDDRWPWYVEVENITPKLGAIWYTKDLYITNIASEYVKEHDLAITNNGAKNLNALRFGWDRIHLDYKFGTYLIELIMSI